MKTKTKKKQKSVKDVAVQKKSPTRSKSLGESGSVKNVATQKVPRTKVSCIQCLKCGDIVYSCATHDFNQCSCKSVFIDGGFDYIRGGGNPGELKDMNKYIPATKQQLYDDWNYSYFKPRKYGCIKPKSSWKSPLSQSSSES